MANPVNKSAQTFHRNYQQRMHHLHSQDSRAEEPDVEENDYFSLNLVKPWVQEVVTSLEPFSQACQV